MKTIAVLLVLLVFGGNSSGQQLLDKLEDALSLKTRDGLFQAQLSGLLDLEGYYIDQRPPGLILEDESFFNPRLSLFVDAKLGQHFYGFLQARVDRGFDPGGKNSDARLDEYLVRWTPWNDSRLNLQF